MRKFWKKVSEKDFIQELIEENPIGTYADFSDEEASFIGHAETVVLESESWFESQKAFIEFIRGIDVDEYPNWRGYVGLKDYQLAYIMDLYFIIDLERIATRTHVKDISLNLNEKAINFISKIYLSRAVDSDDQDPNIMLSTALDLMRDAKIAKTLKGRGSMFRWIENEVELSISEEDEKLRSTISDHVLEKEGSGSNSAYWVIGALTGVLVFDGGLDFWWVIIPAIGWFIWDIFFKK